MQGTDEFGNYTTGEIVEIQGDTIIWRIAGVPVEQYTTVTGQGRNFHPNERIKVYQNGMVRPL